MLQSGVQPVDSGRSVVFAGQHLNVLDIVALVERRLYDVDDLVLDLVKSDREKRHVAMTVQLLRLALTDLMRQRDHVAALALAKNPFQPD